MTAVTYPTQTSRTPPPISAERGTGWLLLTAAIVPLAIAGSAANLLDGGPGIAVTTVLLAGELVLLWRFLRAVGPPPEADQRHLT